MALSTVSAFASYDQSQFVNKIDISPFLSAALIYDFHALGTIGMPMDNPVTDITYNWIEDVLNGDTVTLTISLGTADTSITYSASSAPHVGDYVVYNAGGTNSEVMQVTTVNSTTNSTVSRGYNATTAASAANSSVYNLMRIEQEFSDIGADATANPTTRLSYTSIIPGRDLQISGSQLARIMSTTQMADQVAHQLENRLVEWKRGFTRQLLYGEKVGPGSDTQYRSFGGLRYWVKTGSTGVTSTTSVALSLSVLDTVNKSIVDQGVYPDTLIIGTDLVGSVNAIDATNRRMLESSREAGYMVNRLTLGQGNSIDVVVDARVHTGDAFLIEKARVRPRPYNGRALFTLAGSDWVDGVKRRILGEWGLEIRQPQVFAYLTNKT